MIWLYLIFIASILIEIYLIDPWFWGKGKTDKPWSTLIYVLIVLVASLFFGLFPALIAGVCARALFDPLLNVSGMLPSGKRDLCYHSIDNKKGFDKLYETFWQRFSCKQEMLIRGIWFFLGFVLSW